MRTACVGILSVAVILAAMGPASAQTTQPALGTAKPGEAGSTRPDSPQAAPATPAAMVPFLQAIREANTLSAAAAAYTGGCGIDRQNVELNRAYLRRLLQLGQPQAANVPAMILVNQSAADGLAYGAAGYCSGRQNDLPRALLYTVKAADAVQDDSSIQNNLGQLAAWYDYAKGYKLPPADQKTLDKLKAALASSAAYTAAYKTVKDGYDKQADANVDKQRRIASAEAEVKDAATKANEADAAIKALSSERETHLRSRNDLERQMGRNPPSYNERQRIQIEIDKEDIAIHDIDDKRAPAAQKALQDAQNVLGGKMAELGKVRNEPLAIVPLGRLCRWLPPAVDGVVTLPPDPASKPASAPAPS